VTSFGYNLRRLRNATMQWRNTVMKVMYGDHVNVLMMANMLHVRFVGRSCPVEAVQHRRPMYRYKFWAYTNKQTFTQTSL